MRVNQAGFELPLAVLASCSRGDQTHEPMSRLSNQSKLKLREPGHGNERKVVSALDASMEIDHRRSGPPITGSMTLFAMPETLA